MVSVFVIISFFCLIVCVISKSSYSVITCVTSVIFSLIITALVTVAVMSMAQTIKEIDISGTEVDNLNELRRSLESEIVFEIESGRDTISPNLLSEVKKYNFKINFNKNFPDRYIRENLIPEIYETIELFNYNNFITAIKQKDKQMSENVSN